MWLINSSVGRKVIMSISGLALVLFLLFHMSMNLVALFSAEGYNMICEFLGANWYALIASASLAFLVIVHFVYAYIITIQNRAARGNQRYACSVKPKSVEWASQNMFVLGIIVILGLGLHLFNFWAKMQLNELTHLFPDVNPLDGVALIKSTFSEPIYVACYIVWLVALWFHLTHGFWSAIQTLGWNNQIWFARWRCFGNFFVTLIVLGFLAVVLAFAFFPCIGTSCGAAH